MDKRRIWEEQEPEIALLRKLSTPCVEKLFGQECLANAFSLGPTVVSCIDERISPYPETVRLGVCGSGILFSYEELRAMTSNLHDHEVTIDLVTYHQDCGAVNQTCRQALEKTMIRHDPSVAARGAAQAFMNELALPGIPKELNFHDGGWLVGEPGFHPARCLILDGSGRCNHGKLLPNLKAQFISVRYYPNDQAISREIEVALNIVFGECGYRSRFTPDSPFIILVVGDHSNTNWSETSIKSRFATSLALHEPKIQLVSFSYH